MTSAQTCFGIVRPTWLASSVGAYNLAMRQAKAGPESSADARQRPRSILRGSVTEAASTHGTAAKDESGSLERRGLVRRADADVELQYPARLVWPPPWVGHIPFAFWLVEALRPRVVVELGVHSGNSYCAFLQGVQSLALTAQCYGIDHWRGDEHSDHYGDEVYAELCAYHDPLYGTFSTLIRATFEEALPLFLGPKRRSPAHRRVSHL